MLYLLEPFSGSRTGMICLPCVLRLNSADDGSLIREEVLLRPRSRPTSSPLIHEPDVGGGINGNIVNDIETGHAEHNAYRLPEFHAAN